MVLNAFTMKNFLFACTLFISLHAFSQVPIPNATEICNELIQMVENDMKYRNGEILKSGTFGRKNTYSKKIKDSVWVLQRKLDAANTEKLIKLTQKYGWLSDPYTYFR